VTCDLLLFSDVYILWRFLRQLGHARTHTIYGIVADRKKNHLWHCLQKSNSKKNCFPIDHAQVHFTSYFSMCPIQEMLLMRDAMNSCCSLPRQPWPLPVHIGQHCHYERTLITKTTLILIEEEGLVFGEDESKLFEVKFPSYLN